MTIKIKQYRFKGTPFLITELWAKEEYSGKKIEVRTAKLDDTRTVVSVGEWREFTWPNQNQKK